MGVTESTIIDEKFCGFRIYKIIPGGPLEQAGLKELEDFIIPPNDLSLHKQPFYEYIRINSGKQLKLNIYSLSTRSFSEIDISPGINEKGQGYLGATVRYENWGTADKNLLRVIRVRDNSLAKKKLGLIPGEDFIIAIRPEDEDILSLNKDDVDPLSYLSEILTVYKYKPVEFFIYNTKNGARFEKTILNGDSDEILGCDVAYGKLHMFPKVNMLNKLKNLEINEKDDDDKENNNNEQTVNKSVNKMEIENINEERVEKDIVKDEENKEKGGNNNINDSENRNEEDIIVEDIKERDNN